MSLNEFEKTIDHLRNGTMTRRDSLVLGALGLLGLVASCVTTPEPTPPVEGPTEKPPINNNKNNESSSTSTNEISFIGKIRVFDEGYKKIADGLEKDFGITLLSPLEWQGESNLLWKEGEIAPVAEALSQLPYELRKSTIKNVILLKAPNSGNSEGVGGGIMDHSLALFISEGFLPDEKMLAISGETFGTQRDQLRAFVHCQFAQEFIGQHPLMISDFLSSGFWLKDGLNNFLPGDLGKNDPLATLSWSIGLMLVNPDVVPNQIKKFLAENPYRKYLVTEQTPIPKKSVPYFDLFNPYSPFFPGNY